MLNKIYRRWYLIAFFSMHSLLVMGQQPADRALAEIKHTLDVYKNAGRLSYLMHYTYANESSPLNILDSVSGQVEINGTNYRYVLDSTETISNERYSIMLFKKDRMMYLAKPEKKQNSLNTLGILDSAILSIPGLQCSIAIHNTQRVITLVYPAKMQYRQVQFTTDTVTGFIQDVRCIVKTDQLVDPQVSKAAQSNGYDEYAVVDVTLYGYSKAAPDAAAFDEHRFFSKVGKEYVTTEAYKDYKIFLGTPNL